jgi:DNA-binding GntR family transcriptional regulator
MHSGPIYEQIKAELRAMLERGVFEPGDKFLTERQIATKFKTSRITANKVLSAIVAEGLLEYRRGVGTFVKSPSNPTDVSDQTSLTARATRSQKSLTNRVVNFESARANEFPGFVGESLGASQNDRLYRVVRVRSLDGVPASFEERYIIAGFCPGIAAEDLDKSLTQTIRERFGFYVQAAEQLIGAENANGEVADALELPANTAVVTIKSIVYLDPETPLYLEIARLRPDQVGIFNWIGNLRPVQAAELMLL